MRYFFPIHLNGNNRGCEGIAKGTAQILAVSKEHMLGLCTNVDLDKRLHIDDFVTLQKQRKMGLLFRAFFKIYSLLLSCFKVDSFIIKQPLYKYSYNPFLKQMREGDVLVSTGGDMMCYHDNEVIFTNNQAKKLGVKTVLWGCSMGKENLTERKLDTLKKFDLIYARESLSFDFFKSLGLKNVVCSPDPAFILKEENVEAPECFQKGKVIGINLSNYTVGAFNLNTPFGDEVKLLLNYIFKKTDYHILLIPHVLWKDQDDRIMAQSVVEEYKRDSARISVLDSDRLNYLQIRYIISKCHIFIGSRTHAVISAYSTCVPTIALGYSIKSRGIAKDLGVDEYIVDSKKISNKGLLLEKFIKIDAESTIVKKHLVSIMPTYIQGIDSIKLSFQSVCP